MSKQSFSSNSDRHDSKIFRESLGSFGTTTKPGDNQLSALQTKIREGVKHVELHLANSGKGHFGEQDVPDKYGFEQRKTIMQLAKLNQQTLSVHGTFETTSFSGLGQEGFNESTRLNSIREIDESLKFAAETAKSGAMVFHIQGDGISTDRGELNLSKDYMDWLKKNMPKKYADLKRDYFNENYLKRKFVNNPDNEKEIREDFLNLKTKNRTKYNEYVTQAKKLGGKKDAWELYSQEIYLEKQKLSPDRNPLVMVGDKITKTERGKETVMTSALRNPEGVLSEKEKKILSKIGIHTGKDIDLASFQKAESIFTNGLPQEFEKDLKSDFESIKKKILLSYGKVLSENNFLQAQADKDFHQKLVESQLEIVKLQKKDLDVKYEIYKDELDQIKKFEEERRELLKKISKIEEGKDLTDIAKDTVRQELVSKNQLINGLIGTMGQQEYHDLSKYHETVSQLNQNKKELEIQKKDIKAVTDVSFEKNTRAMGHLGINALKHQMDLLRDSRDADSKVLEVNKTIDKYQKELDNANSIDEKNLCSVRIQKEKHKLKKLIGLRDYSDIDLINKPLYLAPENMLPGMGSLTSLEEFKAVVRMSQQDFSKKILSNESEYKKIRNEYNEEYKKKTGKDYFTGDKNKDKELAVQLAKRHIGGTFDNAHAGVWLKHFKREVDEKGVAESEEHRIGRFNKWLNQEAEDMFREGIIKHVHFNDTQAKDDDHNLLGEGVLDIHDLRERLRRAGLKEALIVEAGGRKEHLKNAFEVFNPTLVRQSEDGTPVYTISGMTGVSSGVSDWGSITRDYNQRPIYSQYGMGENAFKPKDQQGIQKGSWSGIGLF